MLNARCRIGDRGTMRASLPLILPLLMLSFALAVACEPQMTTQPAAAPDPTTPPPSTTAASTAEATAANTAEATSSSPAPPSEPECKKDECGGADAAPPPLRAGKGGPAPFAAKSSGKGPAPCTADTLKKQLSDIVNGCKKSSRSICGDLVLHTASGDAGNDNVSVDFNLGTSENTAGFSKCVVSRINSVKWECAAAGKDIRLDLGCRL